jgi:hypothetical protein
VAISDVNNDGYADLLIGAPRRNPEPETNRYFDSGAMYVFFGAPRWVSLRPSLDPADAEITGEDVVLTFTPTSHTVAHSD